MAWTVLDTGTLGRLTNETLGILGDPFPRFFMSGDGHREPPFQWTGACENLKGLFVTLASQKALCVHTEQFPENVGPKSVPLWLGDLFGQGRIFGWELSIYKHLLPVIHQCQELMWGDSLDPAKVTDDVVWLDREILRINSLLWQIGKPAGLGMALHHSYQFRRYFQDVSLRGQKRDPTTETNYRGFVRDYRNAALDLRTTVNPYIGKNIQSVINQYPDCTHLITCGNAHITDSPLFQYVTTTPGSANGVVDASAR